MEKIETLGREELEAKGWTFTEEETGLPSDVELNVESEIIASIRQLTVIVSDDIPIEAEDNVAAIFEIVVYDGTSYEMVTLQGSISQNSPDGALTGLLTNEQVTQGSYLTAIFDRVSRTLYITVPNTTPYTITQLNYIRVFLIEGV